ncbi:MAG TPA: ATP-binding protein [Verrucomicrobiae bacterium]|nr:ATP-binding protein [Verrucomicrobiae bacterium]
MLSDINQAIVRIRDPQILLSEACRIAVEKGEFRMAWIGHINRTTGAIEPSASAGVNDGYVENSIHVPGNSSHDRGPTVDALRSGVHVVCNDIENDPRMAPWRDEALKRGYRSSAAFPLKIGDEVVGAFNLYSSEQGFFDAQELALLDELASDIGLALEIHRQESERVRAENALREARDQLEHRVAERTRELEEANAKLHELDRIKSQFLANMSHELRTPMNAIIGFAQLLHDGKAGGPVSPEQKEFLGDILNSAGHLLQLINDILDLSKVEAGRMEILLNLLSNAVKFTEQGEIRIGCETAPGKIRLSVSDTGIGIKAEDLAQLFQPFCQLDDSLRKRHEGTGLGLYLSKRLALLLGGDLTVAGEFGKGSTFTLEIPARRELE